MMRAVVKGIALSALALLLVAGPAAAAWTTANTSLGQRAVVGVGYGDLSYVKDAQTITRFSMTVVVVRNNSFSLPIQLNSLRFYSSGGTFVKALLLAPRTLKPLEAARFEINKAALGIAPYARMQANCSAVLEWQAAARVPVPSIVSTVYVVKPDGTGSIFETAASGTVEIVAERVP